MKISYLGIPGSNSFSAARRYFGENHEFLGRDSFVALFKDIVQEKSSFAIIPVENSLAGTVVQNYDLLNRFDVSVIGEYYLKFENHLLAYPTKETKSTQERIGTITHVYSHPQPLMQCALFFEQHPQIHQEPFSDTARAAAYVQEEKNPRYGAIANTEAANIYGLEIVQRDIADNAEHNYTRFFALAKEQKDNPQANKCSLLFTLPHIPGSLEHVLHIFSSYGYNLTKIESRPIHGKPFEYVFSVDITWKPIQAESVELMLVDLDKKTQTYKVLGFYTAGEV